MTAERILVLISLALAIVAAFANVPMAAAAFAILGLVNGHFIPNEEHVRVLVTALVLSGGANAVEAIPAVGGHLTAILTNVGAIIAAAAITCIAKRIWARAMPS